MCHLKTEVIPIIKEFTLMLIKINVYIIVERYPYSMFLKSKGSKK